MIAEELTASNSINARVSVMETPFHRHGGLTIALMDRKGEQAGTPRGRSYERSSVRFAGTPHREPAAQLRPDPLAC